METLSVLNQTQRIPIPLLNAFAQQPLEMQIVEDHNAEIILIAGKEESQTVTAS
jgi:hypothetical protein